jgi:hypothetical protein
VTFNGALSAISNACLKSINHHQHYNICRVCQKVEGSAGVLIEFPSASCAAILPITQHGALFLFFVRTDSQYEQFFIS